MERLTTRRFATAMMVGLAGTLALAGCSTGQTYPPTAEEMRDKGEFFELQQPDGDTMLCWQYGARGQGPYGESPAWFSVTCDWSGENTTAPTTTEAQPTTTLPSVNEIDGN